MNYKENISSFTAADIEKYHRGLLNAAEMHRLEKAALEDPFLADALEGYQVPGLNAEADLTDLQKRLQARLQQADDEKVIPLSRAGRNFPWLRAAAAVILIAGAGWLTYRFGFDSNNDPKNVVQNVPVKTDNPVAKDSANNSTGNNNTSDNGQTNTFKNNPAPVTSKVNPGTEQQPSSSPATQATDSRKDSEPVIITEKATDDATAKQLETSNGLVNQPAKTEQNNSFEFKSRAVTVAPQKRQLQAELKESVDAAANSSNQARTQGLIARNVYRGRVMDANNNPLPFANVTNVQDGIGTYADAKGNFILTSPDSTMNVKVRSIGFESNQQSLQRNGIANRIVLQEDHSQVQAMVLNSRQLNTNRSRSSTIVFEEPEPLDGWENYDAYLANNIQEPDASTQLKRSTSGGEVSVSFEVNEYGEPINFKIEKSLCSTCDKEAIRLIKEGPRWKRKAGKRVTVSVPFG